VGLGHALDWAGEIVFVAVVVVGSDFGRGSNELGMLWVGGIQDALAALHGCLGDSGLLYRLIVGVRLR
jgi:hypothetical protein